LKYNYHTHSNFCDHAVGDLQEYIETAIESGFDELGFTEHAPFTFPGGYLSHYRLMPKDEERYISTLRKLKDKYKNDIKIYIGFEMEYYPLYFDKMLEHVKNLGAEFLIQGQHFIKNEYPDGFYVALRHNDNKLEEYANEVIEGMETGVFSYLAHPDLSNFIGDLETYETQVRKICKASTRLNMPLEINLLGIREKRHYPNKSFWQIAGEEGSPVVMGYDSHSPGSLANENCYKEGKKLIEEFSLNEITKPQLKFL
jgi:histidinol-phosphatase (PHP family)